MTFRRLQFEPSEGLLREIGSLEQRADLRFDRVDDARSAKAYSAPLMDTVYGLELQERLAHLGSPLRILDLGFGLGESSVYLAERGHEVVAVDPSANNCAILTRAAERFGLPIQVVQGPAEAVDQISAAGFDACIFNSSLHHCDDPVLALAHCRRKLKAGGRLLAINEPILKPHRSKSWMYRRFEQAPQETGHYGGNEHIYHFHEYLDLMKSAGFTRVRFHVHVRFRRPLDTVRHDLRKQEERCRTIGGTRVLLKFAVLVGMKQLERIPHVGQVALRAMARASLIPVSFEASVS